MREMFLFHVLVILTQVCFATTFYIDPANGSNTGDGSLNSPWQTLENVVNANLIESTSYVTPYDYDNPQTVVINNGAPIQAGDTLMLYDGMHGELILTNYINTDFITIKAVADNFPILKKIHFIAGKKWRLEGLTISSEPFGEYINDRLIYLENHGWQGPVTVVEIKNCTVFSTGAPWTTATDWVTKASDGIMIKADSIIVENNSFENVHFGITMRGSYIQVLGNSITNFSGDGIRLLGSNNLIESNTVKNCYAVDENHDDGIQSFTSGGLVVDNNTIRRNTIINYEDPNQPLLGSLQGIGCFDGPFNNWVVENNLIIVDHWHGLSLYGAHNCQLINNTVLDPTPDVIPGPAWIKIADFDGLSSSGCTVKNNVSNSLAINTNSNTTIGNNAQLVSYADYSNNFVMYENGDFHLIENSILTDNADISVSPIIDLDGVSRPQGVTADIGAYEFLVDVSLVSFGGNDAISIYPNPSSNWVNIEGRLQAVSIILYNSVGVMVNSYNSIDLPYSLNLESLAQGVYYFQIVNKKGEHIYTGKMAREYQQ